MSGSGYVMPLWPTPHRLALVDRLVEHWLPDGFHHVFFTSGGSESTDSALRLARAYQHAKGRDGRWKIISRHPSYHGMTLGTLSVSSHSGRRAGYEPLLTDFPKVPWNDADEVVRLFEREDPSTIAGFIAEPITGASGACLVADDEYWRTVTELCRRHDVLLIADEVMTGFGRTGVRWGHQHFPFEPDVIVGGKGLGGGYVPMGMVATSAHVAEPLARSKAFMFFTFSGSDAMCAGAETVLRILGDEQLVDRSAAMGRVLAGRLRARLGDHPHVSDIRGRGLFMGLELVRDRETGEQYDVDVGFGSQVVAEALANDVWVYPAGSGPVTDGVMFGCPFVVTEEEIDIMVEVVAGAIDAVAARC
jgi:adenosylmethionine-8-amino-7-oxononanoate aminotransferase